MFAAGIGISLSLWNYLLMGAVSMTTVAAFDSIGASLVVALLVVPPATAYLLTDRLSRMLWYSAGISVLISATGYWLASWIDGAISGAIVTAAGVLFALVFLFSPKGGLIVTRLRNRRIRKSAPDFPPATVRHEGNLPNS